VAVALAARRSSARFPQTGEFSYTPQARWLPDSRHVVFATRAMRLYMGDVESGRYWPVLVEARPAANPTVSPDGSCIAYVSDLSHAEVIEAPLGDGPVRTLLGGTHTHQMADLSSNGQLVFVTNHRGASEVWITSLAEGWERPLVLLSDIKIGGETAQFLMNPAFSPDGRRVAFSAKLPSSDRLFTVFASGGAPVEATTEKSGFEMTPAWSPDGNWLAYSALVGLDPKLMTVRPGSGESPVALGNLWGRSVLEWSPTGEWTAAHRDGELGFGQSRWQNRPPVARRRRTGGLVTRRQNALPVAVQPGGAGGDRYRHQPRA